MKYRSNTLFALASLSLALPALADHPTVAFGSEGSGAINTISTSQVPVGYWGLGFRTEYIDNDEFSTEQLEAFAENGNEGVHSLDSIRNTSASLTYGYSNKLSISARLPYIERENVREGEIEDGEAEAHTHGDSAGFGDILLLGQYVLETKSALNTSLIFGIKAPTGETNEKDDDNIRFETEFQPGTGSWDFLIGASASGHLGSFNYHGNVLYNSTTEGSQSTEIGDALSYNLALTYALTKEHDHYDHSHASIIDELSWSLALELNGETREEDKIDGTREDHSGGTTVFFSPGVRVSARNLSGFLSYGVPVVENQKGIQTDIDARVTAGFSISF